jgi:hypothetical protein
VEKRVIEKEKKMTPVLNTSRINPSGKFLNQEKNNING